MSEEGGADLCKGCLETGVGILFFSFGEGGEAAIALAQFSKPGGGAVPSLQGEVSARGVP